MSSKRKNTPSKLRTDDVLSQNSNSGDGDSSGPESDTEFESNLHIVTRSDSETHDSDNSNSYRSPQTKKQRILQSVKQDSDSDPDSDISSHYTNGVAHHHSTKSNFGLQRKSMESVLRRLSSKTEISDIELDNNNMTGLNEDHKVKESIQVLLSDGTITDKERRLSEMIAQLQSLKENISKQKDVSNNIY